MKKQENKQHALSNTISWKSKHLQSKQILKTNTKKEICVSSKSADSANTSLQAFSLDHNHGANSLRVVLKVFLKQQTLE